MESVENMENRSYYEHMNIKNDLQNVLAELTKANSELCSASLSSDLELATSLIAKIKGLEVYRDEILKSSMLVKKGLSQQLPITHVSLRENVIRVLNLTKTSTQAKLIGSISEVIFNQELDTKKLSSLRRDEQRSYKAGLDSKRKTQLRDVYVVPALSSDQLAPVRGALALSTWDVADRLIAPLSPRVNLLKTTVALINEIVRRQQLKSNDSAMKLIRRLAISIPNVNPFSDSILEISAAAQNELSKIQSLDEEERNESAEKLKNIGDDCFFGNTISVVNTALKKGVK